MWQGKKNVLLGKSSLKLQIRFLLKIYISYFNINNSLSTNKKYSFILILQGKSLYELHGLRRCCHSKCRDLFWDFAHSHGWWDNMVPAQLAPPEMDTGPGRLSIWILHQKKGLFSYPIIQIFISRISCITFQNSSSHVLLLGYPTWGTRQIAPRTRELKHSSSHLLGLSLGLLALEKAAILWGHSISPNKRPM